MGRGSFALTSCVAAVPAGVLGYVLIMAFLNFADSMDTIPMILSGTTLAICLFLVVTPFGILIFGGPKKKRAAAPKPGKGEAAAAVATEDSLAEADEMSTSGEAHILDSDSNLPTSGSDVMMDDTTDFQTPISNAEIELADSDTFDAEEIEDLEEVDEIGDEVILEDEDEDDQPRRKKRR